MDSFALHDAPTILLQDNEAERRDVARYACDEVRPIKLLARPSFQSHSAYIRDFSRNGVGIILARPFAPGTLLALQLRKRTAGVSDILTARVCHATNLAKNYWSLGCRLSRQFTDSERLALQCGDWESSIFGADFP
jgi:hypothetical protein